MISVTMTTTRVMDSTLAKICSDSAWSYSLLSSHEASKVPPRHLSQMTRKQLDLFLSKLQKNFPDIKDRIVHISERFLDTPYVLSPLGEGPGNLPDEDPLVRFDAVDCTTFIEEVMALSLAENLSQALSILRRIRYMDAKVGYGWRKHFTEAQWIPDNQKMGFLKDTTLQVAPEKSIWVHKHLDEHVWDKRRHPEKWPQLKDKDIPTGTFSFPVVPIKDVLSIKKRIPNGTIVNIVREDIPTYPTRVTHQGLLIQKSGRTYLRHAGRAGYGRVVDEPLEHFVRRNMAYRKWVVTGFNLQKILPESRTKKNDKRSLHDNLAPDVTP